MERFFFKARCLPIQATATLSSMASTNPIITKATNLRDDTESPFLQPTRGGF